MWCVLLDRRFGTRLVGREVERLQAAMDRSAAPVGRDFRAVERPGGALERVDRLLDRRDTE